MPTLAIGLGVRVVPIVATLTAKPVMAVAIVAASVMGLAVLLVARRSLGQTSLIGAWGWSLAALVAWAGTELAAAMSLISGETIEPLRLSAIALSFCPIVAVLGAKRPQHTAWNFVVVSLWAIVMLPAAENFFLHSGQKLTLGDARAWFLWILILLGPLNYVPTRFCVPAFLLAMGQVIALSPYLALIHRPLVRAPVMAGLLLVVFALVVAWLFSRRSEIGLTNYDRVWRDFQNHFGLLWSLRVQERVNSLAQQNKWNAELTPNGFYPLSNENDTQRLDPAMESEFRSSLRGLLRRFVSNEWIDRRL